MIKILQVDDNDDFTTLYHGKLQVHGFPDKLVLNGPGSHIVHIDIEELDEISEVIKIIKEHREAHGL